MLGIIAYIMVYYKSPWKNVDSEEALVKEIIGKEVKLPEKEGVSEGVKRFIAMLLRANPEDRWDSGEAMRYLEENWKIEVVRK